MTNKGIFFLFVLTTLMSCSLFKIKEKLEKRPNANNLINFKTEGPATIAAVGNGNAATTEPFQANYRKAFNGLCMLIIKSKRNEIGEIKIIASSEDLKSDITTVISK